MRTIRRNGHWFIALAGVVALAFSAGQTIQKNQVEAQATNAKVEQAVAEAHELSFAFRNASKAALPGMVSIETRGRVGMVRGPGGGQDLDELLEHSPLGEMFKRDPRYKDLLRQRQSAPQRMPQSMGMGSGFVIDPSGIILTANHVVDGAERVTVKLADGREYLATDVKTDEKTDIAIVRIKPEGSLPVLKLGDSDRVEIGDWVLAIGSPFGLDATVTAGIISAKGRGPGITKREEYLQTDAAINPGNSGGPLVNLHGEVIGINTAISTRSGGYDGVGFAVPINLARWVADQLVEKGEVSRSFLGVVIQPVSNDLSRQFNVGVGKGALITEVMPDSPAASAKLEVGDLVLKFNGREVHGPRDMQLIVEKTKPGTNYPLLIVRDGKELTVNVQVKELPRDVAVAQGRSVPEPNATSPSKTDSIAELGIDIDTASPDVVKQLGFKAGVAGVLLSAVKEDGPAAAAGVREGMIIDRVGARRVTSPAEFREAMKHVSTDKGVLVHVLSPQGAQFLVINPVEGRK